MSFSLQIYEYYDFQTQSSDWVFLSLGKYSYAQHIWHIFIFIYNYIVFYLDRNICYEKKMMDVFVMK